MQNKLDKNFTIRYSSIDLDPIVNSDDLDTNSNSKSVLLVNSNGIILFINNSMRSIIALQSGDNLFNLNSEPKFSNIIQNLNDNSISHLITDLLIINTEEYSSSYIITIETVLINGEKVFIVYFSSQDERKKISQKVNTYNQALETVNVGVLIADQNSLIKYISSSFENYFNIRIDEVYNKNLLIIFEKYLAEYELVELENALINRKKWNKVITNINNEGQAQYKELRLNIIQDSFNKTANIIITANDITNYVKQARQLKKSEQRQKLIINNISDPILILTKSKGNLLFENANSNFFADIIGKKIEVKPEINLENINPVLHSIIHEAIINLEDSNRIHAPFHYTSPLSNKRFLGKVTFTDDQYDNSRIYIVSMTDITEQLEVERKLREAYKKEMSLNKLKSTFLANMSHEIRTPLNAIVGYSDLLEDDVKEKNYESSAKMTAYLKEGVNRLLKLVDNIVEVSLLESGSHEIQLTKLNLNHIIHTNKNTWEEQAALRNISVDFDLSPLKLNVEANEEKLERAIKEIIDNAIKYNIDNGKIIISTYEDINENCLQISDSGIGIEKTGLKKIFQLFEQVEDVGYTRKYEGAGLGLSIANKLISFMNGKLNIVSQPNEGTVVTISFPKL